jgi:RNA recognition motif-containing protein
MTNKLFIGKLSYTVTDAQLTDHFAKVGKVLTAKVIIDRMSGQGKGFGFVEMATPEEAMKAMHELNDTDLDGRNIVVKEAKPQEDRAKGGYTSNRQW